MTPNSIPLRPGAGLVLILSLLGAACAGNDTPRPGGGDAAAMEADTCSVWSDFRGIIGDDSPKIRTDGDETWVWAGGAERNPTAENADWFYFTGAPIPPGELQYGLGKDAIPSVDDPVFVEPDDTRLLQVPDSPYRPCERPSAVDEIMVIGHVVNGQARAYPTALLDRHEIVNDEHQGETFAVLWCPLADLAAVQERTYQGEVDEWGVSGYVYRNVFLIYDRATESLWYPFDDHEWTAVAGPREGETYPYTLLEPMPLGEWKEIHPDTEVLLVDRRWLGR